MTDIEAKALALVREVLTERNLSDKRAVRREVSPYTEALCRAIEQHEAFKQEVSDAVEGVLRTIEGRDVYNLKYPLSRFIISKPKPDPLVEVIAGWTGGTVLLASDLRAALEARGLEIREKE
jgi:hypothetical protein